MKGFKPLFDTLTAMKKRLSVLQEQSFVATDKMLMMAPDTGEVQSAADARAFNLAVTEVKNLDASVASSKKEIDAFTKINLVPYYEKIAKVADTVASEKGIKQWFETNSEPPLKCPTDQTLMVDISRDIAAHLGIKLYSLRIGIVNRDSILRLMPGYAKIADSTLNEKNKLDSAAAIMDQKIAAKQHELDSLRPTLNGRKITQREEEIQKLQDERDEYYNWNLYNLDKAHEERTKNFNSRLDAALAKAAKENGCKYTYDKNANIPWTENEAEFVDLSAIIVKQLGL